MTLAELLAYCTDTGMTVETNIVIRTKSYDKACLVRDRLEEMTNAENVTIGSKGMNDYYVRYTEDKKNLCC